MNKKDFPGDPTWLEGLRAMHPFKLFIFIAIIGIIIMFAFLGISFLLTVNPKGIYVPAYFIISTIALLLSSLSISKVVFFYKTDNLKKLHRSLALTFFLGLLFIWFQMKGWKNLADHGIFFQGEASGSFLYLLSGLHLLHFFGGVIFFLFVYFKAFNAYRDKVNALIYVTNPYELMKLELLVIYWHFMDGLWLVLFLIFMLPGLKH